MNARTRFIAVVLFAVALFAQPRSLRAYSVSDMAASAVVAPVSIWTTVTDYLGSAWAPFFAIAPAPAPVPVQPRFAIATTTPNLPRPALPTTPSPSGHLPSEGSGRANDRGVSAYLTTIQSAGVTQAQLDALERRLTSQINSVPRGGIADVRPAMVSLTELRNVTTIASAAGAFETLSVTGADPVSFGAPLTLASRVPASTPNTLYNASGDLYWAGNLVSGAAVGVWTSDGSHVWRPTGNVGIGTTSPYTTLGVAGDIVATNITATGTLYLGNSGTSITGTPGHGINVQRYYADESIDVGQAVKMYYTTGLYLGNNLPIMFSGGPNDSWGHDLYVYRDAADTLALRRSTNAQTFRLYNTYTDASNYERAKIGWNSDTLEIGTESAGTGLGRNINLVGGNVGIGTTNPGSLLTVSNGGTDKFRVNKTSTNPAVAIGSGSGTLHYDGGTDGSVLIKGGSGDRGILELHAPTGNVKAVFQVVDATGTEYDGIYLQSLSDHNFIVDLETYNSNYLFLSSSPNKGIKFATAAASPADVGLTRNSAGVLEINNGTGGTYRDLNLRNLYASGNVGIGTTDPQYKLDVSGTGRYTGNVTIGGSEGVLQFGTGGSYIWRSNNTLDIQTIGDFLIDSMSAGGNVFKIATNGNVGIGTTNPAAKLSVNGDVQIGADGTEQKLKFGNYAYWFGGIEPAPNKIDLTGEGIYGFGVSPYTLHYYSHVHQWLNGMAVPQMTLGGGNLGIGTTSPYAKLAVAGSIVADSLFATSSTATSTLMGAVQIGGSNISSKFAVLLPVTSSGADLVPVISSNNSNPPYIASAGESPGYGDAFQAFDNNTDTVWGYNGAATGGYIMLDFGAGNEQVVNRYTYRAIADGSQDPKAWTFQGSLNGSDWVTLDTQSGQTGWNSTIVRTFDFANTTAYRYYKFVFTESVGGGGILYAREIELMNTSSSNVTALAVNASTGRTGAGTAAPQRQLHVLTAEDVAPVRFEDANGYCEIDPTSTSWTCTSDVRLKKNVAALSASSTLDTLLKLKPVAFNWNKETDTTDKHFGLIAQDVEQVFPSFVTADEKGMKSVSYGSFTPILVSAIQEQDARLRALEARIGTTTLIIAEPTLDFSSSSFLTILAEAASSTRSWVGKNVAAASAWIGDLTAATITARNVTVDNFCIKDVCVTRDDLKSLLDKNGIAGSLPAPTPASPVPTVTTTATTTATTTPTVTPSIIPTPTETATVTPTVTPSPSPSPTETASPSPTPSETSAPPASSETSSVSVETAI